MRPAEVHAETTLSQPVLLHKAEELSRYLKTLSAKDIIRIMHVSAKLAETTKELLASWTIDPLYQRPAIDSFLGDMYSGLQVATLTENDRLYADQHMRILSGLYGILKPLSGIYPYRFELGYHVPDLRYKNLYAFWNTSIADTLPQDETIVDLSAVEYSKTVTAYVDPSRIITPRFLTINPKTGKLIFVVVHAKIVRGAFAHWMICNRIDEPSKLKEFKEIGYHYEQKMSTAQMPVYVCETFKGIGMSVRLS